MNAIFDKIIDELNSEDDDEDADDDDQDEDDGEDADDEEEEEGDGMVQHYDPINKVMKYQNITQRGLGQAQSQYGYDPPKQWPGNQNPT